MVRLSCFVANGIWTNRIFYDKFTAYNWEEQFKVDTWNSSLSCCKDGSIPLYYRANSVENNNNFLNLNVDNENLTFSSSISSKRDDILYGSFRVSAKVPQEEGTNFGFFLFGSLVDEIDIEVLSRDPSTIRTMTQPSIRNFEKLNSTNSRGIMNIKTDEFVEYRFDWFTDKVEFYINDRNYHSLVNNVPSKPGKIILTHRSNGNPLWSMGPPLGKRTVEVKYIDLYFNTTFGESCKGENEPESRFTTSIIVGTILGSFAGLITIITGLYKLYQKYKTQPAEESENVNTNVIIEDLLAFIKEPEPVAKPLQITEPSQPIVIQMEDIDSLYSDTGHGFTGHDIGSRRP